MNISRIIGYNVLLELENRSIDLKDFADEIGFSFIDARKLTEGRLFLPPAQLGKIASCLEISKEHLLENRGMAEYNRLVHNFRNFKNESNQELVLDLIDMYADLAESL